MQKGNSGEFAKRDARRMLDGNVRDVGQEFRETRERNARGMLIWNASELSCRTLSGIGCDKECFEQCKRNCARIANRGYA